MQIKFIKIDGVGGNSIWFEEYIIFTFLFLDICDKKNMIIYFRKEIYLIESFRAKMLIGNDIFVLKRIDIIIFIKQTMIIFCGITIPIILSIYKLYQQCLTIRTSELVMVAPGQLILITIKYKTTQSDIDILFELKKTSLLLYTLYYNTNLIKIMVWNNSVIDVYLPVYLRVECFIKFNFNEIFLVVYNVTEISDLIIRNLFRLIVKVLNLLLEVEETVYKTGTIIYKNANITIYFANLLNYFPDSL